MTLKPHALHKLTPALLPTLTEEDIESYLLPVRMPWRFVKKEIAANPTFALSQNFCIFPQDADSDIKVQFDEQELRSRFAAASFFDGVVIRTVMALDRAYSVQRYADYSCIVTGKITEVRSTTAMVIPEVILDRLRESELAVAIVKAIEKHNPTIFVAEKDRGFQELWDKVKEQARLRSIILPYAHWVPIDNTPRSAAKRAKRWNFRCRMVVCGFIHRHRWTKSFASLLTMMAFASQAAPSKMMPSLPSHYSTSASALVPYPK